jgi:hypothetical protein
MVHVGVSPWPKNITGSLADCAAGLYNENYKRMGTNYKNAGMGRTIYRFGWEEHGDWFPWTVKSKNAAGTWVDDPVRISDFKQCFRNFAQSIKSTSPQALIAWDAELGDDAWNDKVYPGDDVVDRVSRDQYDGSWIADTYPFPAMGCDVVCQDARRKKVWDTYLGPGLVKIANFATRHNKPFDLGEWGVIWRMDGHGGLDNPYFIEGIHKLMTGRLSGMLPGFQPGYASYFEAQADKNSAGQYTVDTRLRSTSTFTTAYPRAAAKYRELFGN